MEGRISSIQQPITEYIRQKGDPSNQLNQRNAGGIIEEYNKTVSSILNQLIQITDKYVNKALSDEEVQGQINKVFEEFKKIISNYENKSIELGNFEYPEYRKPNQTKYYENNISQDQRQRTEHIVYNAKQVENNNIADAIFSFFYVHNDINIEIENYLSKLEDIVSNTTKDTETINKAMAKFKAILYGLYIYEDVYKYLQDSESDKNNKNISICKCSDNNNSGIDLENNKSTIMTWFKEMMKIKQFILKQIDDGTIKESQNFYKLIRSRLILIEMTSYMFVSEEENNNVKVRPLINKISVGDRKLTYKDVAERFIKSIRNIEVKNNNYLGYFEKYLDNVETQTGINVRFLLRHLHAYDHEDKQKYEKEKKRVKQFMCALGTVFKNYLQQSIKGKTILKPIKFDKGNDVLFKIDDIYMRAQKTGLCILYEEEKALNDFSKMLLEIWQKQKEQKNKNASKDSIYKQKPYIDLLFINTTNIIDPININKLIPYFQELKKKIKDKNNIKDKEDKNDDDIG
ncbi:MAG: hypothetical protein QW478_10325, partial [Candidatus Micrarchaeaceae archaeon]